MTQSGCPYLTCEKTAFRASLDLSKAAPGSIVVTWYCRHPFHGMALELGDSRHKAEHFCAACRCQGKRRTVEQADAER